jgi:hypothetical protein
MQCNSAISSSVVEVERGEPCLANTRCVLQYRIEDRLELSRRTRDNVQYLRSCGRECAQQLGDVVAVRSLSWNRWIVGLSWLNY